MFFTKWKTASRGRESASGGIRDRFSSPAPHRKSQSVLVRLAEFTPHQTCSGAGLGNYFVLNFRGKNELAISHFDGKKFLIQRVKR